jgi:hypothetical protein
MIAKETRGRCSSPSYISATQLRRSADGPAEGQAGTVGTEECEGEGEEAREG